MGVSPVWALDLQAQAGVFYRRDPYTPYFAILPGKYRV
jgi:hypothetical protein